MSITLKVQYGTDQKVVKYASSTTLKEGRLVSEVLVNCIKKFRVQTTGEDHALLFPATTARPVGKWLANDRSLLENDIQANDLLEFRKKHLQLRVKLTDGTTKTLLIDTTLPTIEVCKFIGDKILIKNGEEFGIQLEKVNAATQKAEINWLDPNRSLGEQGVNEESHLIYKKKFFVDDGFISSDDPASIHLLYMEAHTAIVAGSYPCSLQEAILFAAFQSQFELRNYNPDQHHEGSLKLEKLLPPAFLKTKNIEQSIFKEHKKLSGMTEVNAKFRYVQLCRSLKTYGMSVFKIQMPKASSKSNKKLVDKYLGITKQGLFLLDGKTKAIEKEYPLDHLRRWSHTETTFTLDFGTYEDDYLNCMTTEGEAINNLISGYIDLIMKKLQSAGAGSGESNSGTADLSAELTDRPAGKKGVVSTSSFIANPEETNSPTFYTTARRAMGRPGAEGSNQSVAQELSAAVSTINKVMSAEFSTQTDGPEPEYSETEIAEAKAQVATSVQGVAALIAKFVEPLSHSFATATPLKGELITEAHKLNAPQVATLVESFVNIAKNSKGMSTKSRTAMLAAAKNLAGTMSNFLLATQEAASNPTDTVVRENVYKYSAQLVPSLTLMDALSRGSPGEPEVDVLELVKQTIAPATSLQAAILQASESYSPVVKAHIQLLAAQLAGYDTHIREIAETLGPYLNDPIVKKTLHDTLKVYNAHLSYLAQCANFETSEAAQEITASVTELKSALNGVAIKAVGAELEPPKVETPPPQPEVIDDTETAVQDELEAATQAIRELSEALKETQQLRRQTVRYRDGDPLQLEKDMINEELGEGILDATKGIAFASEKLMLTAIGLQKELVAAGRANKSANQYKRDPAWAQGLISASQTVTFTIRQLVIAAQGASKGDVDEERLQVLASNVNAAAIRLVTAAKVKAVPGSQFASQLGEVTKGVTAATALLVEKAKRPAVPSADYLERHTADMSMTNRAIREIEVQTKILKLQKALEEAQVELGNLRKEDYAGSVAPTPGTPQKTGRKVSSPTEVSEAPTRKTSNAAAFLGQQNATISTENGGMWPSLRKTSSAATPVSSSSPAASSDSILPPPQVETPVSEPDVLPPPPPPVSDDKPVEEPKPDEAVASPEMLAEKLERLEVDAEPRSDETPPPTTTPAPTPVPTDESGTDSAN